jgi:hypothetical protein
MHSAPSVRNGPGVERFALHCRVERSALDGAAREAVLANSLDERRLSGSFCLASNC